jgi:ubiquitin-conjugating enzyme E2 J1
MENQYNIRSPAVKRLYREANELLNDTTPEFWAQPLDDNLFEWHFTVRGPPDSDFATGVYHGRIILPTEYPMKPPSIIMLTPNGRFEVNKKICLSISGHHPESWQPSWSIRTALLAIIGFMPTEGLGAIGSLDYPSEERKSLAKKSQTWCCPTCGVASRLLKTDTGLKESDATKEAKELAKQICFKATNSESSAPDSSSTVSPPSGSIAESNGSESVTNSDSPESNVQINVNENPSESSNEIRKRNVNQTQTHSTSINENENTNANLESSSSSRFTTYLIVILSLAIAFLLFRRFFLL